MKIKHAKKSVQTFLYQEGHTPNFTFQESLRRLGHKFNVTFSDLAFSYHKSHNELMNGQILWLTHCIAMVTTSMLLSGNLPHPFDFNECLKPRMLKN